MRFWIIDQDQTPQRFPLQRLLRQVTQVTGSTSETCEVLRVRAGYGLRAYELQQKSDAAEFLRVSMAELDELCAGTEQWFYDIELRIPDTDIRFGLHDSTALFVEGGQGSCESVVAAFNIYRRA
jgi:hypothetical protein